MRELVNLMLQRHRDFPTNYIVVYLEHGKKFTAYDLKMHSPTIVRAASGNLTCYFHIDNLISFEMMEQKFDEQKTN